MSMRETFEMANRQYLIEHANDPEPPPPDPRRPGVRVIDQAGDEHLHSRASMAIHHSGALVVSNYVGGGPIAIYAPSRWAVANVTPPA